MTVIHHGRKETTFECNTKCMER